MIEAVKEMQSVIPSKRHRLQRRDFNEARYKEQHLIENFFAKIKQYRTIATRYDKLARHLFKAFHLVACAGWRD